MGNALAKAIELVSLAAVFIGNIGLVKAAVEKLLHVKKKIRRKKK